MEATLYSGAGLAVALLFPFPQCAWQLTLLAFRPGGKGR